MTGLESTFDQMFMRDAMRKNEPAAEPAPPPTPMLGFKELPQPQVAHATGVPEAIRVTLYDVNGVLCRKLTLREGANNPQAIRAISPGRTSRVDFFEPVG